MPRAAEAISQVLFSIFTGIKGAMLPILLLKRDDVTFRAWVGMFGSKSPVCKVRVENYSPWQEKIVVGPDF